MAASGKLFKAFVRDLSLACIWDFPDRAGLRTRTFRTKLYWNTTHSRVFRRFQLWLQSVFFKTSIIGTGRDTILYRFCFWSEQSLLSNQIKHCLKFEHSYRIRTVPLFSSLFINIFFYMNDKSSSNARNIIVQEEKFSIRKYWYWRIKIELKSWNSRTRMNPFLVKIVRFSQKCIYLIFWLMSVIMTIIMVQKV